MFADDRTGAYEVAGLVADAVGAAVTVGVGADSDAAVVDLGTRALEVDRAVALVRSIEDHPGLALHKIDSTLRGNWAAEVRARRLQSRRRLVLLPGWPRMGRTCVGGIVRLFDEPVGTIRDHLPEAVSIPHVAGARAWWSAGGSVAALDLPDEERVVQVADLVAALDADRVVVAGPAGPLAAVVLAGVRARPRAVQHAARPQVRGPVVVVCGSANEVSRRQVQRLEVRHRELARLGPVRELHVLATPVPSGDLEVAPSLELAAAAHRRVDETGAATVVLVGGETAAAYLGTEQRAVGGTIAPGVPWSRALDGGGPLVISKAGGFGGADALVDVILGERDVIGETR